MFCYVHNVLKWLYKIATQFLHPNVHFYWKHYIMFLFRHGNVIYSGTAYPGATKGPSLCKYTAGHTVILNFFPFFPENRNTSLLNFSPGFAHMISIGGCWIHMYHTRSIHCRTYASTSLQTGSVNNFPFNLFSSISCQ